MHFTKTSFAIIIPVVGIAFFASLLLLPGIAANNSIIINQDPGKKAVIIDQLYETIPSQYFQNKSVTYLENAGYEVDYITTEQITVNFYKELPTKEYEYIVIRSHGIKGNTVDDSATLFTAEKYSDKKYILEQLLGTIDKGNFFHTNQASLYLDDEDFEELNNGGTIEKSFPLRSNNLELYDTTTNYFLFGSKAVDSLMSGTFPDSTILLGGCNTMENSLLAEALIKRGASEVIGWSGFVKSHMNDRAMLDVLKSTLEDDVNLEQAVESVMGDYHVQLGKSVELKYYSENNN